MITDLSQLALLSILLHLVCISIAWWALQALNFEKFIRANKVMQARLLYIFLSIILGTSVSNFLLDYLSWSQRLSSLFS